MVLDQIDEKHAMIQQIAEKYKGNENELVEIIGKVRFVAHSFAFLSNSLIFSNYFHGQKSLLDGLKSMETILNSEICSTELRRSYHGVVIDKLKGKNDYDYPAVGVLAGPRLFHHIVDNAAVATKLIRLFNENEFSGEIFFMTLSEIKQAGNIDSLLGLDRPAPPDPFFGEDNESFISCIPAYYERIKLVDMQNACAHELRTLDYKLDNLNEHIQATELEIRASIDLRVRFKRDMNEMKSIIDVLDDLELKVKTKATQKARIVNELNDLAQRKLQLEAERKLALLMPDEQNAVDDIRRKIDAIAIVYRQNMTDMNELRTRRDNLSKFIETYLKPKQRDLDDVSVSYTTQSELLDRDSSELDDTIAALNEFESKLTALNEKIEEDNCETATILAEQQQQRKRKKELIAEINNNIQENIRLKAEQNRLNDELAQFENDSVTAMPDIDENIAVLNGSEVIFVIHRVFRRKHCILFVIFSWNKNWKK